VERRLTVPGVPLGGVLLVSTDRPGMPQGPYDTGAHALDLYTTSADASTAVAQEQGLDVTGDATIALGPLVMRQVAVAAPDHTLLVCIEANRRRPTSLDHVPEAETGSRTHSELHSMLWSVDSIDAALPFWRDEAGLALGLDVPIRGPEVAALMHLPDADAAIRMAMLSDEGVRPSRLELLEHTGRSGNAVPAWPLHGGLHAPLFVVPDVESAAAALPSARCGDVAEADGGSEVWSRALHGRAPGDVHFLLVERA
jgi:hypothetical protein